MIDCHLDTVGKPLQNDMTLYGYTSNNPVNYVDPEGLFVQILTNPFVIVPVAVGIWYYTNPEAKKSMDQLFRKVSKEIENVIQGPWSSSAEKDTSEKWPPENDWRGQCIRIYDLCVNEKWKGNCGDCLLKCTAQHEWPFHNCSPDKKCKR